jgi:hypothetical protein
LFILFSNHFLSINYLKFTFFLPKIYNRFLENAILTILNLKS